MCACARGFLFSLLRAGHAVVCFLVVAAPSLAPARSASSHCVGLGTNETSHIGFQGKLKGNPACQAQTSRAEAGLSFVAENSSDSLAAVQAIRSDVDSEGCWHWCVCACVFCYVLLCGFRVEGRGNEQIRCVCVLVPFLGGFEGKNGNRNPFWGVPTISAHQMFGQSPIF